MTEEEMRIHRCCFSGHRPEKLTASEETVKAWLNERIDLAILEGYRTFITGMAMGVDIWAGQIIADKKKTVPGIHLIAAVPWPGFSSKWSQEWKDQYETLISQADVIKTICQTYEDGIFQKRNEWMVDHSNRVIAYFNGEKGGTLNTIEYAFKKKIEVCAGGIFPDFNTYVAYDLETTGLDAQKDDIIEIGAVRFSEGKQVATFQEFVKPERSEISAGITSLTGITHENVENARNVQEVMADFLEFAGKDVLVGYNNISFDSRFLDATGVKLKNRQFDVMLYNMQFQRKLGFEKARVSMKLLSDKLNIVNPQAHRALADAITTAQCFEALRLYE